MQNTRYNSFQKACECPQGKSLCQSIIKNPAPEKKRGFLGVLLMKNYCIWVVSPPGYVHSHTFDELALGLSCAFRELGYNV